MSNNNTPIIEPEVLPTTIVEEEELDDISTDYVTTRSNLKDLVAKGTEALDGILELAKESEHPRAYEVVGQMLKIVAETNRDLIDLQKNMKELAKKEKTGPTSVTNALFVGSTHELQKLLKNGNNTEDE